MLWPTKETQGGLCSSQVVGGGETLKARVITTSKKKTALGGGAKFTQMYQHMPTPSSAKREEERKKWGVRRNWVLAKWGGTPSRGKMQG